jgi:hypothetical protein
MKRLTKEEEKLLKDALEFASFGQVLMVGVWDVFCPKKRNAFIENIINGMSWKFADEKVKENKKYYQ